MEGEGGGTPRRGQDGEKVSLREKGRRWQESLEGGGKGVGRRVPRKGRGAGEGLRRENEEGSLEGGGQRKEVERRVSRRGGRRVSGRGSGSERERRFPEGRKGDRAGEEGSVSPRAQWERPYQAEICGIQPQL